MGDVGDRRRDVERMLAGVVGAHQRLLAHLERVAADGELDLDAPSALDGRSRVDVLGALVAGAHRDVALLDVTPHRADGWAAAAGGTGRAVARTARDRPTVPSPTVPSSTGPSSTGPSAVVDALRRSAAAWHRAYIEHVDRLHGGESVPTGGGGFARLADIPLLRWRAVEVGHADLALDGFGVGDWSPEYVRRDIERLTMRWRARQPIGISPLPAAVLAVDERTRLAWLLGRIEIDGVAPAALGL